MKHKNLLFQYIYIKRDNLQCDQPKQGLINQAQKMDEYVKQNGFAGWFETSAKENVNIEEAARALVNNVSVLLIVPKELIYL